MPKLQFLADMNISPLTVENLRKLGWKIGRVSEILDRKSKDIDILDYAREHGKVIITQDLDFSAIVAQSGLNSPSVISLRVANAKPVIITRILISVLPLIETELCEGAIVSIDEKEYRIKKLPVEY